MKQKDRWMDKT